MVRITAGCKNWPLVNRPLVLLIILQFDISGVIAQNDEIWSLYTHGQNCMQEVNDLRQLLVSPHSQNLHRILLMENVTLREKYCVKSFEVFVLMRSKFRYAMHSGLIEHVLACSLQPHYVVGSSPRSLRNRNQHCNNTELYLIQDRKGGLRAPKGQNSTLQT